MIWTETPAPSSADIEALTRATIETLPAPYREAAGGVVLRVEDFASQTMLRDLDLVDPFDLTGLYEGIPLTQKSVLDQPLGPDVIWLFRRAILDEWSSRGDVALGDLVAHIFVHELAHHFGWTDDEIARIDRWWD